MVRLTCAVPLAFEEQPDDIMLPAAMAIVNVMSSPDIVPWKLPGVRPCMPEPAKFIAPETVDPFCVSCQVMAPMSACPIILLCPSEMLESVPLPAHVPAMEADADDGDIELLLPHAAVNEANKTATHIFFTVVTPLPKLVRSGADRHVSSPRWTRRGSCPGSARR